jgi:hypothetical protein
LLLCAAVLHLGCTSASSIPPWLFDTAWVDEGTQTLLLADATNGGVDFFDTRTAGYQGTIPLPATPSEVMVANGTIIATASDSNVYFFDARLKTSLGPPVSTGGEHRADAVDYDPTDDLLLVVNGSDVPPFLTFVSLTGMSVAGRIVLPVAQGADQPVWDPSTGLFYVAIASTDTDPFGEVDAVDPSSKQITATYPLSTDCSPQGMALGPANNLVLGCAVPQQTLILNVLTGNVVPIPQVGGSDEVWYDSGTQRYYLAAAEMTEGGQSNGAVSPVIGIIDANTNTWVKNVPIGAGESPNLEHPHAVAVDSKSNRVFVPTRYLGLLVFDSP